MNIASHIANWKKELVLLFIGVLIIVFFEASQQYYYILHFDLAEPSEISYWQVLQGQAYRWLFWIIFAIPLIVFVVKKPIDKHGISMKIVFKYLAVISFLLLLNIITIAIFQLFINGEKLLIPNISEYFKFYAFQKSPIYFIAFIGLVIIIHFMLKSEAMELKMKELSTLKDKQTQLYDELKNKSYTDTAPLIEVKTGNRLKYVPLDTIRWIEADDYCVKFHDIENQSHTIRTSLKALEKELPNSFIRVHRKAIVHMDHIKEIVLHDQPRLILSNSIEVPIAQSRLKNVKQILSPNYVPETI